MIEAAMYVALGFCTAGLIGLAILPAFYRRAARLTEEALRAVNPSSYAEVRAAQDQERARHAVELRRVERQLDGERAKAAKFQLDATGTRVEIEDLKKSHAARIAELEAKIFAIEGDQQAVDLLTAEVSTLKQKLSDAEKALAESWTSEEKSGTRAAGGEADDAGWLPATDTMTLATITGLEAEVATLKAKLAKYEPTVAGEVEASRDKTAKTRLTELEGQLVDTESKYVAAQAEVTRLSLLLDSANVTETELQKRLSAQIEKVTGENLRHQAELKTKERVLERMAGQIQKLQKDLATTPALAELRREFRTLASRISSADSISIAPADAAPPANAQAAVPAGSSYQAAAPETGSARKSASPATVNGDNVSMPETGGPHAPRPMQPEEESAASVKSTEIASAAQALVSRIVASSRAKETPQPPAPAAPAPAAGAAPQTTQRLASGQAGEEKPSKQKKKDVA